MENIKEILELFGFDEEERDIFEFTDYYMIKIEKWLKSNNFNDKQLFRFMIVGLYLYYRATIHLGGIFNTNVERIEDNRKREKKRLIIFNEKYGKEIEDTKEYLKLLTIEKNYFVDGESLYKFVIDGERIG